MPNPLVLQRVHHISRAVRDVAQTQKFYCDVLGFRVVWRPAFDFEGAWLFNDKVQIHLIQNPPAQRDSAISTRADHIAFHVENLEECERRLTEHEVPFRKNSGASGVPQIFFHDPDGNTIELGVYPATTRERE